MNESRKATELPLRGTGREPGSWVAEFTETRLCIREWPVRGGLLAVVELSKMLMLITLAGGENGLSACVRGVPGTEESGVRNGSGRRSSSMAISPLRFLSRKNRGLGGCRRLGAEASFVAAEAAEELGRGIASVEEDAEEAVDGGEGIVGCDSRR
jgi:hypothetical protein